MVRENLQLVEDKIQGALARCGRSRSDVTLVAVSKTKPVSMIQEAYDAGIRDFGENHVQEIVAKQPVLPPDIRWHMIGHLQKNKVRQVIDKVTMIHSVDSVALAREIEKEAAKRDLCMDILLEVNVAEEESKYGFRLSEVRQAAEEIAAFPHVRIRGLMTVAPVAEHPEDNRAVFKKLYDFSVDMKWESTHNVSMSVLSMGMTGDYETAIEEGASMIRVGTGIFGSRAKIGE